MNRDLRQANIGHKIRIKNNSIGMTNQTVDFAAMAILLMLCASWGLQQVVIKVTNQGISPILQCAMRSVGATILILIWMEVRRQPILHRDGTLGWGIAAGLLFSGEFLLIYCGLDLTNASRAVVFLYMSPFVVAVGAQFFIPGDKLRPIQIIGLCCAFAGILIAFGESWTFPNQGILMGDAMLAAAAVFWGATTVLIKASPLAVIAPAKVLLYQLGVSAFVLPLGSLAMGEPGILQITPLIALCLVYQIVWIAFFTYLIWFWMIRRHLVSRLASFTFLTPLFGVIAGAMLLGEPITGSLLSALALVGSGIYLVNRPAPERPEEI